MEPIPFGMRFLGALFSLTPGMGVSNMTLEQIEKNQATQIPQNAVTDFLLGEIQKGVMVQERSIAGPGGALLLRIYTPEKVAAGPRPLIVFYHGGGWVLGNPRMGDWICSTVARDVDAVAVSADYRLAPKHKFPAGVEDCYAALVWCSENAAALGADPGKIGVMGDSAGGTLSAVMCLLAKERGGPHIRHQALIYPATDVTLSSKSHQLNNNEIILSESDIKTFLGHYLEAGADLKDWRISPLFASDHSGLPAAIIIVAGHDPLHDEGVWYADKLRAAGVPVILKDYPAMPHGFTSFPHLARDARPALIEITQSQRMTFNK